ncbi:MAG: hypothetical protein HFI30_05305 [Lachnospiraceae bacterium]|jgi:hypothetical protein|nr:hypothetical protein [Lachnospiraceae bacterium]
MGEGRYEQFFKKSCGQLRKKLSVYQLYRMYQEEQLVFSDAPAMRRTKKIERISETLETILLGISLPLIYESERQDGSLLVLESSDRLRCFIEFLDGQYLAAGLEFYPELNGCKLDELERLWYLEENLEPFDSLDICTMQCGFAEKRDMRYQRDWCRLCLTGSFGERLKKIK